jgi:transcriptional regulator with XRE-family HTH domain
MEAAKPKTPGQLVLERRKELKLKGSELARLTSLTRQYIHSVETDRFIPKLARAERLSAGLGMTVADLFPTLSTPAPPVVEERVKEKLEPHDELMAIFADEAD